MISDLKPQEHHPRSSALIVIAILIIALIALVILAVAVVKHLVNNYTLSKADVLIKRVKAYSPQFSGALLDELGRLEPRLNRMACHLPHTDQMQRDAHDRLSDIARERRKVAKQVVDFSKCPPLLT